MTTKDKFESVITNISPTNKINSLNMKEMDLSS